MSRRYRLWIAVACGWTALALLFAVSNSLTYVSTRRPAQWTLSIERSLIEWWLADPTPPIADLQRTAAAPQTTAAAPQTTAAASQTAGTGPQTAAPAL